MTRTTKIIALGAALLVGGLLLAMLFSDTIGQALEGL
jgi:hypothetical protein